MYTPLRKCSLVNSISLIPPFWLISCRMGVKMLLSALVAVRGTREAMLGTQ